MDNKKSSLLSQAYSMHQNGQTAGALRLLDVNESTLQDLAEYWHLRAILLTADFSYENARQSYLRSLAIRAEQPEVLKNFGNLLLKSGRVDQAADAYSKALELMPNYLDALHGRVSCWLKREEYDQAIAALKPIVKGGNNLRVRRWLADAYHSDRQYESAIAEYEILTRDVSFKAAGLFGLAACYRSLLSYDRALYFVDQCLRLMADDVEVLKLKASVLFESGKILQCQKLLEDLCLRFGARPDVHTALNELYWQDGNTESFGKSFELELAKKKCSPEFVAAYVDTMRSSGIENVVNRVGSVLRDTEISDPDISLALAKLHADVDLGVAIQKCEVAVNAKPSVPAYQDFAQYLLKAGEIERAHWAIEQALELEPMHQLSLALQSTAWKVTGDDRYLWLCDHQRQLGVFNLETPVGYSSQASFFEELLAVVDARLNTSRQPLRQTLVHGVQVPGNFLHGSDAAVQALRIRLYDILQEYCSKLPVDPGHPFYSRNTGAAKIVGSWSVTLSGGGFHVNHVHPEGWISSSVYIKLPSSNSEQLKRKEGAIKFGESSLALKGEAPDIFIQPNLGDVVLFPSYYWHGTVPFAGSEARVTCPIDAIPR